MKVEFILSVVFQEFSLKPGWDARYVMIKPYEVKVRSAVISWVPSLLSDDFGRLIEKKIQKMSTEINSELDTELRMISHGKKSAFQLAFFPVSHSVTKI